mgnify:CR=1 FL=1|tara:strand:+ start:1465 stop:1947 length:483 start_codon:yes stop_codon:yes gene_type:complete
MRGRKPMPSAVQELRGGYDKNPSRRKKSEPKPPDGIPKAPRYLNRLAKNEWRHICKLLHSMGILTMADRSALTLYCQTYSQWRKAVEFCAKYESWSVGKDNNGNVTTTRHEWDKVRERTADSCRRWLIEFGLTPSARTRLQVTEEVKDEFDTFLSRYSSN